MAGDSAGGNFVGRCWVAWERGFKHGFNSIRISKSSRVINAKKCTTAINVFRSCTFFFADVQLVLQLCYFFAVVLISCMIPTYNFAVLPFFLQLYIWFRS